MDELIIREVEGRASEKELEELHRWRGASAENQRRYDEIRAVWALFGERSEIDHRIEVPRGEDILARRAASDRSLARPASTDPPRDPSARPGRRRWWRRPRFQTAAAALLVVGLGVGLGSFTEPEVGPDAPTTSEFRTGPNDLMTAALEDGSVARLGPNTRLRATISEDDRLVELDGRAFFATAHDPERPFLVRTSEGDVRVLGTRFEVNTDRDGLRLLVVDGRVELFAGGGAVELEAGDLGEAGLETPPSVTRVELPEARLDWMGSWVAFESTPLRKVAVELEVRLGIVVEIVDPELEDRTVSGWFSESDRDVMLSMICRIAELTCTPTTDGVQIDA